MSSLGPGQTVDYRAVSPDRRTFRFYLRVYALYVGGCGGVPLAFMVYAVPRFRNIFMSFKTALPTMTLVVLEFSDWLQHGVWILAIVALLALPFALAALTVSLQSPQSRQRLTRWITAIGLLGALTWLLLAALSLFLPLAKIITAVSGSGGGPAGP